MSLYRSNRGNVNLNYFNEVSNIFIFNFVSISIRSAYNLNRNIFFDDNCNIISTKD